MKLNRKLMFVSMLCVAIALPMITAEANNYDDAYKLYKAKDIKGAIPLLEEHCNKYPKDPRGGYLLAQCYRKTKQVDKAAGRLQVVLEHHPDHDSSQFLMGHVFLMKKNPSKAIKHFEEAVKLQPENGDYQYYYGSTLLALKKYPDAAGALKKAVTLNPKNSRANLDYGRVLVLSKDYQKAIAPLKKASQSPKTASKALYYLGNAQLQLKEFSSAVETFKTATTKSPDEAKLFYSLGIAQEGAGGDSFSTPEAYMPIIQSYSKAVALDGSVADYHFNLGKTHENAVRTIYEKTAGNETVSKQALDMLAKAKTAYESAAKIDATSGGNDGLTRVNQMIDNIKNPKIIEVEEE